jgi:Ca-activated chloride channel family protein
MIITPLPGTEDIEPGEETGLGALHTERGNLPLYEIDAAVTITGLLSTTVLTQGFRNPYDVPLEATYIFPLPPRAAVTALRLTADDRTVDAELSERGEARAAYDAAIEAGQRAAIAEEERPDVFTMRVGNIVPGERVSVALTVVGPLSYEDGEATYRLPLVVAPRYIPGTPLSDDPVGAGWAEDTDAVPDASRVTPPVLLPGFANPVRLSIGVDIDPAGLPLGEVRSSLHTIVRDGNHVQIQPGERVNRDFILRLAYGDPAATAHALVLAPDGDGGTFQLTLVPPTGGGPARPRDVVLVLDRSGSMGGWKMVAARRAASRIVDTLTTVDRFAVLTFDSVVEHPDNLPRGLVAGTDRHRYRAVEHLSRVDARGGTELLAPLTEALDLLRDNDSGRDRVLILVTDGQVGNEDQILAQVTPALPGVRVHTVGIDEAVNAGFLGRLATVGSGRCELVESEDRLDDAMERIHRRIAAPLVTQLRVSGENLEMATVSPARPPSLFAGAPVVIAGRYRGEPAAVTVSGRTGDGRGWTVTPAASVLDPGRPADAHAAGHGEAAVARDTAPRRPAGAVTVSWARAHLRDLEDAYSAGHADEAAEQRIVATSLRFGVLCRFTAWLAVDTRVVAGETQPHRVVQPVEQPRGWVDAAPMGAAPYGLMAARTAFGAPATLAGGPAMAKPAMNAPAPTAGATAMDWMSAPPPPAQPPAPMPAKLRAERKRDRVDAFMAQAPMAEEAEAVDELAAARAQAAEEARALRAAVASWAPAVAEAVEAVDGLAAARARAAEEARALRAASPGTGSTGPDDGRGTFGPAEPGRVSPGGRTDGETTGVAAPDPDGDRATNGPDEDAKAAGATVPEPDGDRAINGPREDAKAARATAPEPDGDRAKMNLLADLGSRLAALVRHLASTGVDEKTLAPVRELAVALDEDALLGLPAAGIDALWARALAVLDALATPPARRRAFWKA